MKPLVLAALFAPAVAAAEAKLSTNATLILGDGQTAQLHHLPPRPSPRWVASLGRVTGNTFSPGNRMAPGFVVIAEADTRAAAIIALVGKGSLPTHTAAGAEVTVEIAGKTFGPVIADKNGDAEVPVEVPPGVALATVKSRYFDGRATVRKLPLPATDFPLALVIAPLKIAKGERRTVTLFAIGRDGRWSENPPIFVNDSPLDAGPLRPMGPGRWDVTITGVLPSKSASVRVIVDGVVTATQLLEVTAPPPKPRPPEVTVAPKPPSPPPLPLEPPAVAVYAGGASAFGPLASVVVGGEYLRPIHRRLVNLALLAALSGGYGRVDRFRGDDVNAALTQVHLGVGARASWRVAEQLAVEATAGLGGAYARSAITGAEDETSFAPLFFAGAAAVFELDGAGELVLDARWTELRLDDVMRIEGNALGATLLFGYRFRL